MKWLSNTYNPKNTDARYYAIRDFNETQEEAWQRHLNWLKEKVIDRPKATEAYTVEELEEMNLVGVYLP